MESLILLGILVAVGCWLYDAGRRTGSHQGYQAGFRRGRFRR
jgi:hypothetical protein